jgi:hypothetical protein
MINGNIRDIRDHSGYIDALGKEAAAKAINDAQIKVAQENQRGSIGRAEAEREQAIRVANAQAEAKRGQNTAQAMIAKSDADLAAEQAEATRRTEAAQRVAEARALEESYHAQQQAELARAAREKAAAQADQIVKAEIERERQACKPSNPIVDLALAELVHCGLMLGFPRRGMFSQGPSIGASGVIPDGVHLMIPENRECASAFHHVTDGVQNLANLWAAIDIVAEEHDLPSLGVAVAAGSQLVAELVEKSPEIEGAAVDVADDVVGVQYGVCFHGSKIHAGFFLIMTIKIYHITFKLCFKTSSPNRESRWKDSQVFAMSRNSGR